MFQILREVQENSTVSVRPNQIPVEQLGKVTNHAIGDFLLIDFPAAFFCK
jgi:hypothetical protein